MITYKDILIKKEEGCFITNGLLRVINNEIKLIVKKQSEEDYLDLLYYLIDYVLQKSPIILTGQAIAYHSWLLQFVESNSYFLINEAEVNGEGFCEGVDYSICVLNDQKEECNLHDVSPVFPTFSQNIVISKGVYEGLAVDGVRYSSPSHMTGWWLTTDLYDSNVDSMINVHYFHVAFKRPDLLRYLALPTGYRFFLSEEEHAVWFDDKVG
jgi:hypothetical protein